MTRAGVIDCGCGNFSSVWNAVRSVERSVEKITRPGEMEGVTHLILPGVGSFSAVMDSLRERQMAEAIREVVLDGETRFLGICVGMQVLAERGEEHGTCEGLGIVRGVVRKMGVDTSVLPLPHMGWSEIRDTGGSPLFAGMDGTPAFYFAHSYHLSLQEEGLQVASIDYGGKVVAAVSMGLIHGVQFHPERSQVSGVRLLKNFLSL